MGEHKGWEKEKPGAATDREKPRGCMDVASNLIAPKDTTDAAASGRDFRTRVRGQP